MEQEQEPRWQPTRRQLLWAGAVVAVLTIAILIGYRYDITLWDWIKLLVVPAVIAAGGLWFNAQQREREQHIANERAQDEALQAYLDQMSDMLIPNNDQPSLSDEHPPDSLKTVARARTLTVLPRLAGDRKARVVQFLYESGLIHRGGAVLDLSGADLIAAYLIAVALKEGDLRLANLRVADLRFADLSYADLSGADLRGTNLSYARLSEANLGLANLRGANLSGAILRGADLKTNLSYADLSGADLSGADLSGAYVNEVDLSGAKGWTEEQLALARSLEGATMPNGQKYEDWIKDREGRGKDGEDASP